MIKKIIIYGEIYGKKAAVVARTLLLKYGSSILGFTDLTYIYIKNIFY